MGEYEDRYPDAYGRDEPAQRPENRTEVRDRSSRRVVPETSPTAAAPAWRHVAAAPVQTVEPAAPGLRKPSYRGVGPRGYVRSPARIYEDVCDRLTDHPLIDASDIEVLVSGIEVVLAGSVDNPVAAGRAEAVAREVPGVNIVRNTLTVRAGSER